MLEDFKLMESNAHTFNKSNSLIAQYSTKIRTMVEEFIAARNANQGTSSTDQMSADGSQPLYLQARDALLGVLDSMLDPTEVKDSTKTYSAGDLFRALVPKNKYPDYYKVIKRPISINMMQKKLKSKEYSTDTIVADFEDDVFLMLSNAAEYNEPESEVMADARVIKAFFIPRMIEERKKLNMPPRTLPPEGRSTKKEVKSEDVTMTNGIESVPRILLKMNGQKKAASPASLPDSSKQTTAVSTPAAMSTAQSPPPALEQQMASRNPFKTAYSPNPTAPSPSNVRSTTSVSPMITNAAVAPPAPSLSRQPSNNAMSPPSFPKTKVETPNIPRYSELSLPTSFDKDGMIVQPVAVIGYSFLRKPGTTENDSPIQSLRLSCRPEPKPKVHWSQVLKPEKDTYRSNTIFQLSADQSYIRIEPHLHPTLVGSQGGYGIWLTNGNHRIAAHRRQNSQGGFSYYWDLNLVPGKHNILELVCDMLKNDNDGKEVVERVVFWINVVVALA
ncbi:hypothetical protein ABW20_dc0106982 [Dactylellina cionopaga]|nr:hypothetical protein ABW20_dc0106982 [Dactylellina cionopaga]